MTTDTSEPTVEQRLKALEDRARGLARAVPDPTAPLWMQNVAYPAGVDRTLLSTIWAKRFGVIRPNDLKVGPRTPANLSVDVAPGSCLVQGSDTPNQGSYLETFTDVTNVPLAPAPPAGQQRMDLIVFQVQDDAVLGTITGPRGQLKPITGIPGASPVTPTQPPSSLLLATVGPITSSTTQITAAQILDYRWQAATDGALIALYEVPVGAQPYTISFENLPQNFTHLVISGSTAEPPNSNPFWIWCQVNHSGSTEYYADHMGIAMDWWVGSGNAWNPVIQSASSWQAVVTIGANIAGWTSPWFIVLPYYSNDKWYKSGFSIYGSYGAVRYFGVASLMRWIITDPIWSLTFYGGLNFYQGSQIEVRGI